MKGYYINLDEAVQRKEHFEQLKLKYPFLKDITRFKAIKFAHGGVGCGLSHIKTLKMLKEVAKKENLNYISVFEDDFFILNNDNFIKFIEAFKEIEKDDRWDVIVLTPRGNTMNENINKFKRIKNNQTTAGYIIKTHMIDIFINNFSEAVNGFLKTKNYNSYSIDQYWKQLQHKFKFFYYCDIFAGQLPGYSYIEKKVVNYNQRFITQTHC